MNELAHPVRGAPNLGGVETFSGSDSVPRAPVREAPARAGYRPLILVGLLLALGAIVIAMGYRAFARPAPVRVEAVVAGTVREQTLGPGTVQSRYSVAIGSRVAGTIDSVLADVGDEVQKDQILARLDRTELDARFRAARGAVSGAEQDVLLARANLEKARSDSDLARIRDGRARSLAQQGVMSTAEADEARGALQAAGANERAASAAVDARAAALARLVEEQRVAQAILSYTAIESPMAGVITRRAVEPGTSVAPGAVAFQIVDANALWVATLIDQSLAGRVEVGQRAHIRLRSGAKLRGYVARIAFEADPVTRELEIDVAFDERPARFAIHEEADVTIIGEPVRGLTVPLAAVSHGPDGTSVHVVQDGRAKRREVRLGMIDAKNALVLDGLAEGEAVIVASNTIMDGQRVSVTGGGR